MWIQPLASSGVAEIWKAHGFVQLWAQPAIHKCNLQRLFLPKAVEGHKKAGKFKCSSSEILGLYQVLAHYVQICCLPNGICLLGSTCSLAWCKVLDYRLSIPDLEKPDYKQLLSFVEAALEATVAADWSEEFEPKMHWSLHIIVKVSRGMANYLHAGPWKGSTKALENMGMSCATLPIGKLL